MSVLMLRLHHLRVLPAPGHHHHLLLLQLLPRWKTCRPWPRGREHPSAVGELRGRQRALVAAAAGKLLADVVLLLPQQRLLLLSLLQLLSMLSVELGRFFGGIRVADLCFVLLRLWIGNDVYL